MTALPKIATFSLLLLSPLSAREFHVATTGDDASDGGSAHPLRSIQAAANQAKPGDIITVHEGTYRERIDPPRGGESDVRRIIYQAAPGAKVAIKGSEIVKGWTKLEHDAWRVILPNRFFGSFNPYADEIHGDWFNPKGRKHHTGVVYHNGHWLTEAAKAEEVLAPATKNPLWFATVDAESTTITAQFPGTDPNTGGIEINVRKTVFYPSQTGRNFITVRGFTFEHAGQDFHLIRLLTLRGEFALPRLAAIEIFLNVGSCSFVIICLHFDSDRFNLLHLVFTLTAISSHQK